MGKHNPTGDSPSGTLSLWRKITHPAFYVWSDGGGTFREVSGHDQQQEQYRNQGFPLQYERVGNEDKDGPKIVWARDAADEPLSVDYRAGIVNGPENPRAHIDYSINNRPSYRDDTLGVITRIYDPSQREINKSTVEVELSNRDNIETRVEKHAEAVLGNRSWVVDGE